MPRLLLIDDDAPFREVLAASLVRAGHVVVQAENGHEGAEFFLKFPADVVITDLVMPNREGIEMIAALGRDWPTLPIIAMSGGSPVYLAMAAKLGAHRTIAKPFTAAALLRIVDELLAPNFNPPPAG